VMEIRGIVEKASSWGVSEGCLVLLCYHSAVDLLGSIRLPTLFPNGGHGPLLPEPFDHETSRLLVVFVDIVIES
jgi:hypothetical protein